MPDSGKVSGDIVIEEQDALIIAEDGVNVNLSSEGFIDTRIDAEDAILTIEAPVMSMNGNISLMADDMDFVDGQITGMGELFIRSTHDGVFYFL